MAVEYFNLANNIVAFYVIQTLLFVNTIYKEKRLLEALCNDRSFASKVTWLIAISYISIVIGCATLEFWLTVSQNIEVAISSLVAAFGRCSLIAILAWACSQLILKHIKYEKAE